ncbi:hypothetical protein [Halioxenophilus aromaticivorans]|uniref:Uncharacterized protein n=1 Tax=Halioxenophilus aromaticivorans TaxID=1306992 RepID=A0AAV3TX46_9ALTE
MNSTPDPTTPEGRSEIARRLESLRAEAKEIRRKALENLEDEPSGALTNPSEIDLYRDRTNED